MKKQVLFFICDIKFSLKAQIISLVYSHQVWAIYSEVCWLYLYFLLNFLAGFKAELSSGSIEAESLIESYFFLSFYCKNNRKSNCKT